MEGKAPDTIVLIHGLWMTALSWDKWVERYSAQGYNVIAKSWPGMDVPIDQFRADTSAVDHLGIGEVVDFYEGILRELDTPPIIMGHSFGGVFTQVLLDRGFGAAGVAVDSAAPKGIYNLPLSTLKAGFPILKNPANNHRAVMLSPEEFHYAFANTFSEEESGKIYEKYAVPGPGRILFQGALANFNPHSPAKVDFHNNDRAPLLLIAGGADHTEPASTDQSIANHYKNAKAVTEFKEFPGRSHFILGQPGWEEVADYALAWAVRAAAQYTPPASSKA